MAIAMDLPSYSAEGQTLEEALLDFKEHPIALPSPRQVQESEVTPAVLANYALDLDSAFDHILTFLSISRMQSDNQNVNALTMLAKGQAAEALSQIASAQYWVALKKAKFKGGSPSARERAALEKLRTRVGVAFRESTRLDAMVARILPSMPHPLDE